MLRASLAAAMVLALVRVPAASAAEPECRQLGVADEPSPGAVKQPEGTVRLTMYRRSR